MIEISYFESINGTVAAGLAIRAEAELHKTGLADDIVVTHWDNSALVAFNNEPLILKPVGLITFEKREVAEAPQYPAGLGRP